MSDESKTPPPRWKGKCTKGDDYMKCPDMKETYGDMSGERYRCATCGETYYLDYEEMK